MNSILSHEDAAFCIFSYLHTKDLVGRLSALNHTFLKRIQGLIANQPIFLKTIRRSNPNARQLNCYDQQLNIRMRRLFHNRVYGFNGGQIALDFNRCLLGTKTTGIPLQEPIKQLIFRQSFVVAVTESHNLYFAILKEANITERTLCFSRVEGLSQELGVRQVIFNGLNSILILTHHLNIYSLVKVGGEIEINWIDTEHKGTKLQAMYSGNSFTVLLSQRGHIYGFGRNLETGFFDIGEDPFIGKLILKSFQGQKIHDIVLCNHGFVVHTEDGRLYSFINKHENIDLSDQADIQEHQVLPGVLVKKVVSDGYYIYALSQEKKIYVFGGIAGLTHQANNDSEFFITIPMCLNGSLYKREVKTIEVTESKQVAVLLEDASFFLIHSIVKSNFHFSFYDMYLIVFSVMNNVFFTIVFQQDHSLAVSAIQFIGNVPFCMHYLLKMNEGVFDEFDIKKFNILRVYNSLDVRITNIYSTLNTLYLTTDEGQTFRVSDFGNVVPLEKALAPIAVKKSTFKQALTSTIYRWFIYPGVYVMQAYFDDVRSYYVRQA